MGGRKKKQRGERDFLPLARADDAKTLEIRGVCDPRIGRIGVGSRPKKTKLTRT